MKVLQVPDPKLRVKTQPIKKITRQLLSQTQEMINLTKTFVDPEGVGLASTQVGEKEQYFIMKHEDGTFITVFNPQILFFSKLTKIRIEGCLSIPTYWGETTRPVSIKVRYLDQNGNQIAKSLKGIDAWIFQHEYDHLQGRLFVDLVLEQKSRLFKVTGKDRAGEDILEAVRL